ncbi:MAG: hypothetical protein M3472_06120, partial [Chloroflexota bacterium]|nr:hypothetical protein [Chloroflexota bacterium]
MVISTLPESGGWLAAGLPPGTLAPGDGAGDPLALAEGDPAGGEPVGSDPEGRADPEATGDAGPPEAPGSPDDPGLPDTSADAGAAVHSAVPPAQPTSSRERPMAARTVERESVIAAPRWSVTGSGVAQ